MSAAAALARVDQLQALVARARTTPAPSDGFASAMQSAQATAPVPAAATPAVSAAATPAAAPVAATPKAGAATYQGLIQQSASANNIDPALLTALIDQESGFNPTAGSPAGAQGLTQLMPGTAAALGVKDVSDPAQAIEGGARYLAQQLQKFKTPELALAAYNAGPGAVERFNGVPPYGETQNYVRNVMAKAQAYRS